jgi:hypothetical protein
VVSDENADEPDYMLYDSTRDYYEQTDILQKKGKYQNGSKNGNVTSRVATKEDINNVFQHIVLNDQRNIRRSFCSGRTPGNGVKLR